MATWSVKPTWKKSVIERNYLRKGDNTIMFETGWRWGEFHVHTDDDNPPVLESGVDVYNCGYEAEMIGTEDGCWEESDFDDCDDDTREWVENFLEEGNSWYDLMDEGWDNYDCEMIIDCDMEITRINDDGTEGETITTGSNEEFEINQTESIKPLKIVPGAAWPFSNATEPTEYAQFKCTSCDFTTEDIMDLVENDDGFVCPKCGSKVEM